MAKIGYLNIFLYRRFYDFLDKASGFYLGKLKEFKIFYKDIITA